MWHRMDHAFTERNLSADETIDHINNLRTQPRKRSDILSWIPKQNGMLTTKTAYTLSQEQRFHQSPLTPTKWLKFYRLKPHDRYQLLMWKIILNILPWGVVLTSWFHVCNNSLYYFRNSEKETPDHLFLHCSFSTVIWSNLPFPIRTAGLQQVTAGNWIKLSMGIDQALCIPKEILHSFQL